MADFLNVVIELCLYGERTCTELTTVSASPVRVAQPRPEYPGVWNIREWGTLGRRGTARGFVLGRMWSDAGIAAMTAADRRVRRVGAGFRSAQSGAGNLKTGNLKN